MLKNPFLNALAAFGYIILVVSVIYFGGQFAKPEDSILAPIAVLSLFTLSAAVMAYIFGFEPAQLYFGGKKKQGVKLFLQTMGSFGIITLIVLVLAFSGIF